MAYTHDFFDIRHNYQYGSSLLRQFMDHFQDICFCANIQTTCRLIKNVYLRIFLKPSSNNNFLLISTT